MRVAKRTRRRRGRYMEGKTKEMEGVGKVKQARVMRKGELIGRTDLGFVKGEML